MSRLGVLLYICLWRQNTNSSTLAWIRMCACWIVLLWIKFPNSVFHVNIANILNLPICRRAWSAVKFAGLAHRMCVSDVVTVGNQIVRPWVTWGKRVIARSWTLHSAIWRILLNPIAPSYCLAKPILINWVQRKGDRYWRVEDAFY